MGWCGALAGDGLMLEDEVARTHAGRVTWQLMKARRAGHRTGRGSAAVRLGLAVLLAAAITAVLVIVGRVHQPNYAATIFGQSALGALALKSWLATVTLGLAGVQVLLALWLYRKLPFAPAPARWVGVAHRLTGVVLIGVTIPVAVHCLNAYGVQLSSLRLAVHSLAGCFLYGAFAGQESCWSAASGCPAGRCRWRAERWSRWSSSSGTPPPCGTSTASGCPTVTPAGLVQR